MRFADHGTIRAAAKFGKVIKGRNIMPTEKKPRAAARNATGTIYDQQVIEKESSAGGNDSDAGGREQRIRTRAYEIWENTGRSEGSHETHWHEATRQIDEEDAAGKGVSGLPGPGEKDPVEGSRETAEDNLRRQPD